jgi:hypothetical protein
MQATQNFSTKNHNGHAASKNSALPDPKKVNSQTDSRYGKSKPTKSLKGEHQRSGNQDISFPESDHQKNQVEPHNKDVAQKQAKIESENINFYDKKEFEKIQSQDSSETTISYSQSSEPESYTNTKKNDLLQEKMALEKKIEHLKTKMAAIENVGGREYENQSRELEGLKNKVKLINNELGIDNSHPSASPASEKLDLTKAKKTEEISSKGKFNELVKAIQLIEDEIRKIEEKNDGSVKTKSNIIELEKDRDHLISLMEKFTEIFETEKYDTDSKKSDPPIDKKPKIKRTSPVPRTADAERKVARSKLINTSSDQNDYYQELCSRFDSCLKKINAARDRLEIVNSKTEDDELKTELRRQYKNLGDVAHELQAFSPDLANDSDYITRLLEKIKSPETIALENEYSEALKEYKRELDTWSCTWLSSAAGKLLAGPLAFGTSFLVGNTITRLVPPDHQRWVGYSIGPAWSGAAHALFTGPIANQLLSQMWTSPILGEMKNYFLLLASYGADRWKGELDKKKYRSKNTEKAEKLTIVERWAEERSIFEINWERMKTEEAGYLAYTMNYILKGIGPTAAPAVFASKDLLTRGYDAIAHGVAGAISGAQYVYAQQHLRSLDPKAEEKILPTRAISGMEAAKLKSLAKNLEEAIDSDQYKNDPVAQRALARLQRTTNRAAIIAERKSHYFGTLTHELMNSLKDVPSLLDMTAEALGRIVSLMFVAGMSQVTSELRKSTDPGLRFLGHAILAIDLIVPPGWAFRGLYTGYIRAALELVYQINKSDEKKPDDKKQDTVTLIPKIARTQMDGTSQSAPERGTAKNDVDNDADNRANDDKSVIVSVREESSNEDEDSSIFIPMSDDSSDSDEWHGNPRPGDQQGW